MYKENREKLSEIRQRERKNRKEFEALTTRQSVIDAELNQAYEKYLQSQADNKAGEATAKVVSEAEAKYLTLQAEKDGLSKEIEVSGKVAEILKGKVTDAEYMFSQDARSFYQKQLEPHFTTINELLSALNTEIEKINAHRRNMQADQVSDSILKGIDFNSQALICKKKLSSIETRNFITQL